MARLAKSTRSFDRARMIVSYSMILLVHWNSSLAAYLSLMPDDEVRIATIPTPADLQAPSMCTVQIGSEISAVLCVSGVQSAMKSARA
jgi:hypothetical protein